MRTRVRFPPPHEFARLGEAFDTMVETPAETTEQFEAIDASLALAAKGDTRGRVDRIPARRRTSVARRWVRNTPASMVWVPIVLPLVSVS